MSKLIKGTHHVSLKCDSVELFQKTLDFYLNTLGLELVRTWGEGEKSAAMISTGNSIIEVFAWGRTSEKTGSVNHFALATDDVDQCIETVRKIGCPVTVEPKDVVIGSAIPFPARVAFCVGPVGEEIEFFCEK